MAGLLFLASTLLLGPSAASGETGASPCTISLAAEIDEPSFAARGDGPAPTTRQLETLRQSAGQAFKTAAEALCRVRRLKPDALAGYRYLLIQSGSGATEATFYVDPESHGENSLVFQWVFVEENLALPEPTDIEAGILCWADPDAAGCAERAP